MKTDKENKKMDGLSPLFISVLTSYVFSEPNSFEEYEALNKFINLYKTELSHGTNFVCPHFLDSFFDTLGKRGNIEHIKMVDDAFHWDMNLFDIKTNETYHRFLIRTLKYFKK